MIDSAPLAQFKPLAEGLLRPIYADYSFANIPATIHYLLTGERLGALLPESCFGGAYPSPSKVVLFFIDSFGWKFWQEHQSRFKTTRRVGEQGIVTPISALFPSTTAASVATLSYGVPPSQHALYEWNVYIPEYGEVIQTLPFMPLGRHASDACLAKGYDPARLVAVRETAQQRLARHGVRTIQFAHSSYANSAYSKIAFAGTELIQHDTLAEALVQLKQSLAQVTGKALFSFYWGGIDHIGHKYGPGTAYHDAETGASGKPSIMSSAMSTLPIRSIFLPPTTATATPMPSRRSTSTSAFPASPGSCRSAQRGTLFIPTARRAMFSCT